MGEGGVWVSAGKLGDTGGVAGMRITLSGAMRARDVSRPTEEQLAAAAEREARTARPVRPGGASAPRGAGSAAAAGPTATGPTPAGTAPGGAAVAEGGPGEGARG